MTSSIKRGIIRIAGVLIISLVLFSTLRIPSADAALTITSHGTASNNTGGGSTSLTVNKPSGTVAGDVLLAQITVRETSTTTTITPPSGWTLIRRDDIPSTLASALYYKMATGSEPGSYTWTFSSSQKASGGIAAYTNVTSAPIDVQNGQVNNTASTAITAPSVITTAADDMLIYFASATSGAATISSPAGMSSQFQNAAPDPNGTASRVADQLISAAGATGTRVGTSSVSTSSIGQVVALKAAPSPTATTVPANPWYNSSWRFRKPITILRTKVGGNITNFPVLISITDTSVRTNAQNNGNDILFTANDKITKLSHEIEKYDSATGQLVAWVKLPSLSSAADTTLYMYYGNASAASQQNATAVWDTSFKGVWHLKEISGARADSTSNNNDLTASGSPVGATAQIGNGTTFVSGNSQKLNITDATQTGLNITGNITFSAWVKTSGTAATMGIISKTDSSSVGYRMRTNSSGKIDCTIYNSSGGTASTDLNPFTLSGWNFVSCVYDGVDLKNFENAVNNDINPWTTGIATASQDFEIGTRSSQYFNGQIDEVRISSAARSAAWITTEYNNQSSPSTFYTLGAQEAVPTNTPIPPTATLIPPTATTVPTFTISGNVYIDSNKNGVKDTNEANYQGAAIALSGTAIRSGTTNTSGDYSFTSLSSGTYTDTLTIPTGYLSTTTNPVTVALTANSTVNFGIAPLPTNTPIPPTATIAPSATPLPTSTPSPTVTQVPPTVTPTPSYTLSGNVYIDTNRNGVKDSGEAGYNGATLSLTTSPVSNAVTAATGNYSFTNVQSGSYDLILTIPAGYSGTTGNPVAVTVTANSNNNFGIAPVPTGTPVPPTATLIPPTNTPVPPTNTPIPPTNTPVPPTVRPNTPTPTAIPTYTISGEVYIDSNNNGVKDTNENGAPGISVNLDTEPAQVNTTSAQGSYQFTNIPAGVYPVSVIVPSGYFATTDEVIFVGLGANTTINFGIAPIPTATPLPTATPTPAPTATPIPVTYQISGAVYVDANVSGSRDSGETGFAGVEVQISTDDTVVTDTSGNYSFPAVPAGTHSVSITVPGSYSSTTGNPQNATVGPDDTVDFGIAILPTDVPIYTISGTVFDDSNNNGVQDIDETGVNNVIVALSAASQQLARTDSDGNYQFSGLERDIYSISVTIPGAYIPTTADNIDVALTADTTINFGIALAPTITPVPSATPEPTVTTIPSATPTPELTEIPTSEPTTATVPSGNQPTTALTPTDIPTFTIAGTIFADTNGNGVQDIDESVSPDITVNLSGNTSERAITDNAGIYTFAGLTTDIYDLSVEIPAGYQVTTNSPVTIGLTADTTVNFGIVLIPTSILASGGPSIAVTATSAISPSEPAEPTNEPTSVSAGTPTVSESPSVTTEPAVSEIPTVTDEPTVTPVPRYTVTGMVYKDTNANGVQDTDESGYGNASVSVTTQPVQIATTNLTGQYLFNSLPEAVYTVSLAIPGGYDATTTNAVIVTLTADTAVNFGIVPQPTNTIVEESTEEAQVTAVISETPSAGASATQSPTATGVLPSLAAGRGRANEKATKSADVNNDGVINIFDFSVMLNKWQTNDAQVDLNNDGIVDIYDLSILLRQWEEH